MTRLPMAKHQEERGEKSSGLTNTTSMPNDTLQPDRGPQADLNECERIRLGRGA